VKVKSFRAPRWMMGSVAQGRTVLRGAWAIFRALRWISLAIFIAAAALGALLWPHDPALLGALHFWGPPQEDTARAIASFLGTWGDYPTYNLPLALAIWIYGAATQSSSWRRIAVICFLGATLAGLFDDCFRLTLGRPRPDTIAHTHMADGFYGITYAFRGGYQSFPSGHAASVFGTAAALLVTELPLGLVTLIFALGVIWARMELYRHYPSDVAVGSIIGIYFGLVIGWGAKLRLPRRLTKIAR
jgi:membrane-associated phospholipid phosphatase